MHFRPVRTIKLSCDPSLFTTRNSISPRRSSRTAGLGESCQSFPCVPRAESGNQSWAISHLLGEWDDAQWGFPQRVILLYLVNQHPGVHSVGTNKPLFPGNRFAPSCLLAVENPGKLPLPRLSFLHLGGISIQSLVSTSSSEYKLHLLWGVSTAMVGLLKVLVVGLGVFST